MKPTILIKTSHRNCFPFLEMKTVVNVMIVENSTVNLRINGRVEVKSGIYSSHIWE